MEAASARFRARLEEHLATWTAGGGPEFAARSRRDREQHVHAGESLEAARLRVAEANRVFTEAARHWEHTENRAALAALELIRALGDPLLYAALDDMIRIFVLVETHRMVIGLGRNDFEVLWGYLMTTVEQITGEPHALPEDFAACRVAYAAVASGPRASRAWGVTPEDEIPKYLRELRAVELLSAAADRFAEARLAVVTDMLVVRILRACDEGSVGSEPWGAEALEELLKTKLAQA